MTKTGHIMSLEHTKHMIGKDLLHCSYVTPNQKLMRSFQTFTPQSVDDTTQQTSQIQTAVQNELSVGSE